MILEKSSISYKQFWKLKNCEQADDADVGENSQINFSILTNNFSKDFKMETNGNNSGKKITIINIFLRKISD